MKRKKRHLEYIGSPAQPLRLWNDHFTYLNVYKEHRASKDQNSYLVVKGDDGDVKFVPSVLFREVKPEIDWDKRIQLIAFIIVVIMGIAWVWFNGIPKGLK